ncbi:hypothetical protein [Solibacillus sp. CAU 1738]|uniref:hypothetical protein n=1 Tax=Solibacillus sp. CAU 1738 TaxID=3140363 RepID=UPI0032601B26
MEHFKKSMNEVIGKERWMTHDLARKMSEPINKPKRKTTPVYALLGCVTIAVMLFMMTLGPNDTGILPATTTQKLGENGELFNQYFEAIKTQDRETLDLIAYNSNSLTLDWVYNLYLDELYSRYEYTDFSKTEFITELDNIIWLKFVMYNKDGKKRSEFATYFQIIDGKIYEQFSAHPFFEYDQFDIEIAQAQAIFGSGPYQNRHSQQLFITEQGTLILFGHLTFNFSLYNKIGTAIDQYLKGIDQDNFTDQEFHHPRLIYRKNGEMLLKADGFEIVFTRKGDRILVDNYGFEYFQQGRR